MEYSRIGLNDLPDEIFMIIFKKLNNVDILYAFQGVNQRLNQIIHDPIFTNRVSLVKWFSHDFIDIFSHDLIRTRFCLQILPEIHDKIRWLDLELSSMKCTLHAANYPNLRCLGLNNIDEESVQCLLTDEILSSSIFKTQITTLLIAINPYEDYMEMLSSVGEICENILTVFTNLNSLTMIESSYQNCVRLNFSEPLVNFRSETLSQLIVRVQAFDDCLYLLDGRFNQLHTLYIDLVNVNFSGDIENQGDLPNLKCFSLSCEYETSLCDERILPLLYRMSNLEQLGLYIVVRDDNNSFIDGNYLKKNIINRMPRLNQFAFSINSVVSNYNELNLPSTEDIQRTFVNFPINNIISYVDYFSESNKVRCHIYSYPSVMEYYKDITNNFPGGLFQYVRAISLIDEYPFEYEFFLRIQKSFPFLEKLFLTNEKPQNHKQFYRSNNDHQHLSVIQYRFLHTLCIISVHDDYIEQFLSNTKTHLPNNVIVYIEYESLERVTHNFTREATRINCTKVDKLYLRHESKCLTSLEKYFPHAKIIDPKIF